MKKLLSIMISVMLLVTMVPMTAFAENGPSEKTETWGDEVHYYAFINAFTPDDKGAYFGEYGQPVGENHAVFSENTVHNTALSGISYNRETNELTLDDSAPCVWLSINMMGDDFTIRVDGRVALDGIVVYGDGYGGNLHIKGNGELTVNENKRFPSAIVMKAEGTDGKVYFGSDVKVKLFANEGNVIETEASSNADKNGAYTFENGMTAEIAKTVYSYEKAVQIKTVRLADPDEDRWGGYIVDCRSDSNPDNVYVTDTEIDEETGATLHTLGKYVYIPQYDAYVRDYAFGDRYSNGYEYVFTEDEWNRQTEFTPRMVPSEEPEDVYYYDPEDPEGNYCSGRIASASDPDGVYGFTGYQSSTDGVVTFDGYRINRYVMDSEVGRYVVDDTYEPIYMTPDELDGSDEWSVVYGTEQEMLTWTGTVVQGEDYVYADKSGNQYVTDYDANVYTFSDKGVQIGDDFYRFAEKANDISAEDLEMLMETVTVDDLFNYALPLKEFFYNSDGTHTHRWDGGTVTKAATCAAAGVKTYTCTCGETKTEPIPATGKHTYDAGRITKTTATTYTKTFTCKVCKKTYTKTYNKSANTLVAKGKTATVKLKNLKKKNQTVSQKNAFSVTKANGKVTYTKSRGNKNITVSGAGRITVKKGLKKGTYKIEVKVKAAGDNTHKAVTKTVTVTIKVK